ncbi:MAG: TIGR00730 family Rossman fold protein [Candidatus Eremiobacterota bacterium]
MKKICIYCSSSDRVKPSFFKTAIELGEMIGLRGWTLVYGGTNIGLMGAVARAVHSKGGHVTGVIPSFLKEKNIAYNESDELFITENIRERKKIMEDMSDGFIALPGGFGTVEEVCEILTLKQLQIHNKPVVFLNTDDYYKNLIDFFEHMYRENFAKSDYRKLYSVIPDPVSAISYIENYVPVTLQSKWFK